MSRESISRETFIKGVAAGAVVAASLGTLRFAEYSTADKAKKHSFVPGTYTSSAKGMESDVKVTITVDEKSITDASVDVSGETAGIGAAIGDEVTAQILDAQTPEIDGVAGATVSSQAVRDALTDAIARAEAGEADPETEAVTEGAAEGVEAATEAAGTQSQEAAAGGYVPGTYSATAKGIESDVKVDVTVDESSITDVAVDVSGETAGLGADIGDEVISQILAAQSANIDGVAGATITSDAVKAAVGDALAQAGAGAGAGSEAVEAVTEGAAQDVAGQAGGYVPGTYSATAKGIESDVKVDVTVDESSITDVAVDVSGETAGLGADIGDEVISQILAAQSADIDGVAGATITSDAVKAAAADALAQAGAGAAGAAPAEAAETVTEGAVQDTAGEAAEAVTEGAAAEAVEAQAPEKAAVPAGEPGSYKPGTYTASAPGMESDVSVTFTIDETGNITSAGVNTSGETPEIGAAAGPELMKQLFAAQSARIDGVAGATVTSDAIKAAAADALAQAAGTGEGGEAVEAVTEGAEEAATEAAEEAATEGTGETASAPSGEPAAYTPGSYTASAPGMESDVSVSLTIGDNGKITAAGVNVSGETPEIGAAVGPEVVKQLLAAQSAEIDGVAGATVTSDAIKAAAADALAQAAGAGEGGEAVEAVTEGAEEADGIPEDTVSVITAGTLAQYANVQTPVVPREEPAEAETESLTEAAGEEEEAAEITVVEADGIPEDAVSVITAGTLAQYANVQTPVVPREEPAEAETESLTEAAGEEEEAAEITVVEGDGIPEDAVSVITAGTLAQYANVQTPVVPREEPAEAEAESLTEAAGEEAGEEAGEALTEAAEETAQAGTYKEGSYRVTLPGLESDVTVVLTFDGNNRITAVGINASGETPELGGAAASQLAGAILAAQGADVEAVAGATVTSEAIINAAKECLDQASE